MTFDKAIELALQGEYIKRKESTIVYSYDGSEIKECIVYKSHDAVEFNEYYPSSEDLNADDWLLAIKYEDENKYEYSKFY